MVYLNSIFSCAILVVFETVTALNDVEINIDVKRSGARFKHFWKSTGLCPLGPQEENYKYMLSHEEKINLALIGALPHRGLRQVRIHWLLNLISFNKEMQHYNFTYLDELMEFLIRHNLQPGFELMGLPMGIKATNHIKTAEFWRNLSVEIATRYIRKFGHAEVLQWKFETWNEPDLKTYNLYNFTLPEYLQYVEGLSQGISGLRLGGPAGLFRDQRHPLCWGLLASCTKSTHCPIQFISFHRKGDGTVEGLLNGTLALLDLLHNKFPHLIRMPIANDESDFMQTWSRSWPWLGDVRYAAMVVAEVASFYQSIILDRKLNLEILSNDNAFLNYHPFYFTQRTLLARFQMNRSEPPHEQFIKKPVYSVMALLSLLGDEYLGGITGGSLLRVLATRRMCANQSTAAILLAYVNNNEVNIGTRKSVKLFINNLSIGGRFVVYLMDNIVTNPYQVWQDHGAPVFPDKVTRNLMRQQEEVYRLYGPKRVAAENLTLVLELTLPSVALLHICSKPAAPPGPVVATSIFNITRDEVLLTWSDKEVNTKCIRTYEVEVESRCDNSLQFRRVNLNDTIFLSYHHAATGDGACEATIGRYRVRAVDYWDQPGPYSPIHSYP